MSQSEAAPPLAEGRYRLVKILGAGGMATVYRGYDARLQVFRAIKILAPALAKKKSLRNRFEAEASTMALLEHKNIVRVYDVGADGDRIYIVMELIDGGSLLDRVKEKGPLPPKLATLVTIDMLDALRVAHSRGVVHRDIKPHNVLLSSDGHIRITDFGIARMRKWDDDDGMTKTGAVMGTWGFMAPEQRVDAKSVDVRADVYSVGATFYSILTDKTPVDLFAADMDTKMLADIPEPIADVIRKSTRYNREDRYGSVEEMAAACRGILSSLAEDPADTPPLVEARPAEPEPVMERHPTQAPAPGTLVPGSFGDKDNETDDLDDLSDEKAAAGGTMVPESFGPATGIGAAASPATMVPEVEAPRPPPPAPRTPTTVPNDLSIVNESPTQPPAEPHRGGHVPWGAITGFLVLGVVALAIIVLKPWKDDPAPPAPAPVVTTPAPTPPAAVQAGVTTPAEATPAAPADAPPAAAPATPAAPSQGRKDPPKEAKATATPKEAAPAPVEPKVETPPAEIKVTAAKLEHNPPRSASVGTPLTLTVDLPPGDWKVTVYYRPAGTGSYSQKNLFNQGGSYTGVLPVDERFGAGLQYWIKAEGGGQSLTFGSGFKPQSVPVK